MTSLKIHLSQILVDEIARIGKLRLPVEACGVILPDIRNARGPVSQVVELPNRSLSGQDSYVISMDDMMVEIEEWLNEHPKEDWDAIAVWHTHPAGNIGPSAGDMHEKRGDLAYLVVALTSDGGAVPSWF